MSGSTIGATICADIMYVHIRVSVGSDTVAGIVAIVSMRTDAECTLKTCLVVIVAMVLMMEAVFFLKACQAPRI